MHGQRVRQLRRHSADGSPPERSAAGSRARRVQPDPLPSDGLGQRPVQDNVDPVDRARRERAALSTTASAEVGVEAIDVRRRELRDRQVTEVRFQVVLDEALCLPPRACRPIPRRRLEPAIEQLGQHSRHGPGRRRVPGRSVRAPCGPPARFPGQFSSPSAVDRFGGRSLRRHGAASCSALVCGSIRP